MAYLCSQNSFILRYKLLFTMRTNYARLRKLFGALSLSLAGIFSAEGAVALDSLQLIPRPVSVSYAKGTLTLPKRLTLSAHTPRVLRDGLAGLSISPLVMKLDFVRAHRVYYRSSGSTALVCLSSPSSTLPVWPTEV